MLKSQNLDIERSDLRAKLNGLVETRESKPEYDEMRGKLADLDKRHAEALRAEALETGSADFDGESAEVRSLVSRSTANAIIASVAQRTVLEGPEAELQAAFKVGRDVVPWALMENRAAATFTADTGQASIGAFTGKAFADSIAAFVGCQVVQVPAGESDYPILGTGATVGYQTGSTAVAESDGVFTVEKLSPRNRYQASFAVREQDLIAFQGAGGALTEELRLATRDRLDQDLMTKANEGLFTTKTGTVPPTPGAATTYAEYLAAVFGAVDGIHAMDVSQTRLVVDKETYGHMGAVLPTGGIESAAERLGNIAQVRVTPHSSASGNYHDAVIAKMGATPNAVMALFGGGVRILEDPYTRAAEGERRFYGVLFGDLAVLRTDAYDRARFRIS